MIFFGEPVAAARLAERGAGFFPGSRARISIALLASPLRFVHLLKAD
jgi:hypothetical protein